MGIYLIEYGIHEIKVPISMNMLYDICNTYGKYTVFIEIDAHSLINTHLPPSSASSWHTKMDEIDYFCIKMHEFEVRF